MKTYVFFILILICSCSNSRHNLKVNTVHSFGLKTLILKPGVGINNVELRKSTIADILNLKNFKFLVDSAIRIADGIDSTWYSYQKNYYDTTNAILFTFDSETFTETIKNPTTLTLSLQRITIQNNKSACFINGLCIGTASRNDIIKAFGPLPTNWNNESFIPFREKGVSCSFDDNSKLFTVEIYEPDNK